MLLKTIEDVVDNYIVTSGDASAGFYRGFVRNGAWVGWTSSWPRYSEKNRIHLIRAQIELDNTNLVVRQGIHLKFGVLVRQCTGVVFLCPQGGLEVQGFGTRLSFGPVDAEWGVASAWPSGALTAGDVAITSLLYQRYLP